MSSTRRGTRRQALCAIAGAGVTAGAAKAAVKEPAAAQRLPQDWKWDQSIKDFATLKQNVMKFSARKGPNIAALSVLGEIEQCRNTMSAGFLAQQAPSGWLRTIDALVIGGEGYRPFHEMMIKQREKISECIHLKQVPKHRLRYLDPLMNPRAMRMWIETQDWRFPWAVGNIDMDTAFALAFEWKVMGNAKAQEALAAWFDWHDRNFDPKTGFWDFARTGRLRDCMAGAMHQFGIYFMFNRDLRYPEQAADATVALQEPTGLFAPDSYSNNCLDIDAVFILANIYNKYGVRKAKIREALERAFAANLKCFHPDGGAMNRVGIDKQPDWWSTWCRIAIVGWSARILGISEYEGPWDFRPRHPFKCEDGGKSLPDWTDGKWYDAADWPRPARA